MTNPASFCIIYSTYVKNFFQVGNLYATERHPYRSDLFSFHRAISSSGHQRRILFFQKHMACLRPIWCSHAGSFPEGKEYQCQCRDSCHRHVFLLEHQRIIRTGTAGSKGLVPQKSKSKIRGEFYETYGQIQTGQR